MSERVSTHDTASEANYWSKFYERHDFDAGSSFCEFIGELPELPNTIIDFGCGQGRDSFAFARTNKNVYGFDRSEVGIEHANNKSKSESLDGHLSFDVCDVSDKAALIDKISAVRSQTESGDICYYMRFFLHSIPEEAQDVLLSTLAEQAQPGDIFAAEFRTDKDEDHKRVFGDTHYRRYQNADEFSKRLRDEYGWEINFETESRGLSPYKDEDPTLYRVLATRPLQLNKEL